MLKKQKQISCIIAAYNEQKRIADVILSVIKSHSVDEIIVVDDCSEDKTKDEVRKIKGVNLLVNNKNLGKLESLVRGVNFSRGKILLFLDADLLGLTATDVKNLIEPVKSGIAQMSLSYRGADPFFFKYIIPSSLFLTGERVLAKKDFWEIVKNYPASGFEFEILSNYYFLTKRQKIAAVTMDNLRNVMKFEKYGFPFGLLNDFRVCLSLIRKFGLPEIIKQIVLISLRFQFFRRLSGEKTVLL